MASVLRQHLVTALKGSRGIATAHGAPPRVLVTGALGQLGTALVKLMRGKYGNESIVASDIRHHANLIGEGPFYYADVVDKRQVEALVVNHGINVIIHFSALLSAVGELNVPRALDVNINGFQNVMEIAKTHKCMVFCPSTIGAFGPTTPKQHTPDLTIMRPTTIYGITKVHVELLGEYYFRRYGVDFRSVRYPGIISADTPPGGGTTDYAIDIYHHALRKDPKYKCFLRKDSRLPMMYLPDCLNGTMQFLDAPREKLTQCTYNMAAIDFTPEEIANSIKKRIPNLEITYEPDFRQAIADSWPESLDDSKARQDWGWKHEYDLDAMTDAMLKRLKELSVQQ